MKINLCKILGVEEGEEFRIDNSDPKYRVYKNKIQCYWKEWRGSGLKINDIVDAEVIKLPNKKQLTEDELCILKNIEPEFNVLGKNINGTIYVTSDCEKTYLKPFNNLFQSLDVGEEIEIGDYVER